MDDIYEQTASLRTLYEGSNVTLSYDRPLLLSTGVGTALFDENGRRFLDTVNNVAVVGHCHQEVLRAQIAQIQKLNTNSRYYCSVHSHFLQAVAQTCPQPLRACYLVNSGSEANDLALQIAAAARPGANHIAVMEGGYHGHVSSMMRLSPYKFWGPNGTGKPDNVHVLPLPDSYRNRHLCGATAARAAIQQAEAACGRIAAFFCESELSCAGQVMLPQGFLADVYREMRNHGSVCIADEVQCGLGRLGDTFWGFEAHAVVPDILVFGKGIGNGYPLAGLVTSHVLVEGFAAGPPYFNTFGGNNVACASGLAVLNVIKRDHLQNHSREVGAFLLEKLSTLQQLYPDVIGHVRGRGLFIGLEIVQSAHSQTASPGKAHWIKERMKALQVLMSADGVFGNVLKIKPPLVFTCTNANELVSKLQQTCSECSENRSAIEDLNKTLLSKFLPGQQAAVKYREDVLKSTET
eukprot:jgi/Ulvmu1/4704/UM002_0435.1